MRDVFSALLSAFESGHWVKIDVTRRYIEEGMWTDGDKLEWVRFVHSFQQGLHEYYPRNKKWHGVLYTRYEIQQNNLVVAKTTVKPKQHPNSLQTDDSLQILVFLWHSALGINVNPLHYHTMVLRGSSGIDDRGPDWLQGLLSPFWGYDPALSWAQNRHIIRPSSTVMTS